MDRHAVAAILDEMGTLLELQGANPFKSRAFHTSARSLEALTLDLATLVREGRVREIKGIGESIAAIVSDLVETGVSAEYQNLRQSVPEGLMQMLRIEGLGPKRVKLLYDELGIATPNALEHAAKENTLSTLKGFGPSLQAKVLHGVAVMRERAERSLYPAAAKLAHVLCEFLKSQRGVVRVEVAGSLRRRKEVIGDIDILATAAKRQRAAVMQAFAEHSLVREVTARGATKTSVVLQGGVACDLRIVDDDEFPFALQYFTGSKEHNVELRSRARARGWSLNEYGFSTLPREDRTRGTVSRPPRCRDEKSMYEALDLAFIPPELREDRGEFDAAAARTLPRLVEESDLRGTLHCHTTFSDGLHSLELMGKSASERGWEYLGIADHSKAAAYAGGLSKADVLRQCKEIDEFNGRHTTQLLKGTECDILSDGSLDWPDSLLREFEYVVVSIHGGFHLSEKEMTKRIIRAITHKHVTMLGHPTGRLLLAREGYAVNMEQVIQAAADHGKMIEINAHPSRLDLDWRLCRFARDKGVMLCINPDAHSIDDLGHLQCGVNVARKGWLRKQDILNTRPLDEVRKLCADAAGLHKSS